MNQLEINVPSGDKYIIREQTGADDDVLSQTTKSEATALNQHIANIILTGPKGSRLTLEDVEKLTLRDKYAILIKSRIFSLGDILIFEYKWDGEDEATEYEVDLKEYIWDYSTELPEKGSDEYSPDRIVPYKSPGNITWSLKSGSAVEFMPMDGIGEKYLLKLKPNERTINKKLISRGFKVDDGNKMVTVKNFGVFSARDMVEIRNKVDTLDPPVEGNTTLLHPSNGAMVTMPVIAITDFFYPAKI